MLPNALYWRGRQYVFAGDLDAAERLFRRAADLGLSFANAGFAQLARGRGDYERARALMLPYLRQSGTGGCLGMPEVSFPIVLEGQVGGDAAASLICGIVTARRMVARAPGRATTGANDMSLLTELKRRNVIRMAGCTWSARG